jgi:hypothetical protein
MLESVSPLFSNQKGGQISITIIDRSAFRRALGTVDSTCGSEVPIGALTRSSLDITGVSGR